MNNLFVVKPTKLIAVDSASIAYIEVPIDETIILLGTGNWGKSSLINAMRFFLLPETTLANCATKFAFLSSKDTSQKGAYYSKDEVRDHYFPSEHSRLILEVEHRLSDGTRRRHCQIIAGGNDYQINRYFINQPYDDIQHLFWDKTDEGAGERPKNISGRNLLSALKEVDRSAIQVKQTESLNRHLYDAGNFMNKHEPCYVIFPLKDLSDTAVESVRSLVKLIFNQDSHSITMMTGAAVNQRNQNNDNKFMVDVQKLIHEHTDIENKKQHIRHLKSLKPEFEALKSKYQELRTEHELDISLARLIIEQRAGAELSNRSLSSVISEMTPRQSHLREYVEMKSQREGEIRINDALIDGANTDLEKIKKRIKHAEDYLLRYPSLDADTVKVIIEEELLQHREDLQIIIDVDTRNRKVRDIKEKIEARESSLKILIEKRDNFGFSLVSQLPDEQLELLMTLNPKLFDANPLRTLSESELKAFDSMYGLFTPLDNGFKFFNVDLLHSALFLSEQDSLQDRIDNESQQIEELKDKLYDLCRQNDKQTLHDLSQIKRLEQNIESAERELKSVKRLDSDREALTETNEKISNYMQKNEKLTTQLSEVIKSIEHQKSELAKHQVAKEKVEASCAKFERALEMINAFLPRYPRVEKIIELSSPDIEHEIAAIEPAEICQIESMRTAIEKAKEARDFVIKALVNMCAQRVIEDTQGILKGEQETTASAIHNTFTELETLFNLLEDNEDQLRRDTEIHNKYIRNRLDRMKLAQETIKSTVDGINQELAEASINDLEGVRLSVVLNGPFEDLVKSWIEFDDLDPNNSLPTSWYNRLQEFMSSEAVTLDGKLLIDNLIMSAGYESKKLGNLWEKKTQSTSTQLLTSIHFCKIFLNRLTPSAYTLALPLIMDECGQVSSEQFRPIIDLLYEDDQSIIGITTHGKSGGMIAEFGNFQILDEMTSGKPYHPSRAKVSFPRVQEYLRRVLHSTQDELGF